MRRTRDGALRIDVAGHVFRIVGAPAAARAWIGERYRPFLTDKPPSMTLTVRSDARWTAGRPLRPRVALEDGTFRIALANCRAEGDLTTGRARLSVPRAPAALSPSLFRALSSLLLVREAGFLLHAAAVAERGRAWVFCGPSESGKTTIARLAGDRRVLNDETVAIVRRARGYAACATPFFGEGGPAMATANASAPIRGVCFLHKAPRFFHRRLSAAEAAARAWPQVFLPKKNRAVVDAILGSLTEFAARVECFDLFFAPRPELWEYLDGIA